MQLILTEKPSVAQQIGAALGIVKKEQSHYVCKNDYLITWAYGHLVEIDDSDLPKKWDMKDLPILVSNFKYRAIKNTSKHFNEVKKLLKQSDTVIIATDAGREGELIARLILYLAGYKGKILRLWTSLALTEDVVKKEMKNLKDGREYDSLYYSALARMHADFIVGINFTRYITLKANDRQVWSVGRVQTPALAFIVKRELDIQNFKPTPYGVIKAVFKDFEATLLVKSSDDDEEQEEGLGFEQAQKIYQEIKDTKTAHISKINRDKKKEPPPNLFSLTKLQRHMNSNFGLKAQQTLNIAQTLYEDGYISYPRTDAEHLGEQNIQLVKDVLRKLNREDLVDKVDKVGKRVFDNKKLTDHHAIIPLKDADANLKAMERTVYEEIKKRFLAVFYDDFEYELVKLYIKIKDYTFTASGKKVLKQGWKELYGGEKDKVLPHLSENQPLDVNSIKLEKKFTKPPSRYTEANLLKVMEKYDLGTPATRAAIIERLKDVKYIIEEKKQLKPTEKAIKLITEYLDSNKIVNADYTKIWEKELEAIYKSRRGYNGYRDFMSKITDEVKKILCEVM